MGEGKVVDQTVPERGVERLADAVENRLLHAAAARLVELKGQVQQELVSQLLVGHAGRQRCVCPAAAAWRPPRIRGGSADMIPPLQQLVKGSELVASCNLLQLGEDTVNLGAK